MNVREWKNILKQGCHNYGLLGISVEELEKVPGCGLVSGYIKLLVCELVKGYPWKHFFSVQLRKLNKSSDCLKKEMNSIKKYSKYSISVWKYIGRKLTSVGVMSKDDLYTKSKLEERKETTLSKYHSQEILNLRKIDTKGMVRSRETRYNHGI